MPNPAKWRVRKQPFKLGQADIRGFLAALPRRPPAPSKGESGVDDGAVEGRIPELRIAGRRGGAAYCDSGPHSRSSTSKVLRYKSSARSCVCAMQTTPSLPNSDSAPIR